MHLLFQLFLVLAAWCLCSASAQELLNPVEAPILNGTLTVTTRLFAQIPDFNGRASRINHLTFLGDDIFVCTETSGGLIYKISPTGTVSLWADIAARVLADSGREMNFDNTIHGGLRSLAFHPNFNRNGLFYVSMMETRPDDSSGLSYLSDVEDFEVADSVVAEFRFNRRRNIVVPGSYRQVIRVGMPVYDHPIKDIAFRGNLLYITHGDGSVQSATSGGGQRRDDALGKILRINPRRRGSLPYSIPRSNPFVNNNSTLSEIWALGFRNPHNLCFGNRGQLFVTEVGRDNVDEVNIVQRGRNYGWSEREGTFVHLEQPGLITGIAPLPRNDSLNGFTYPSAQVGHTAMEGESFVGQALAGACPVENGSANDNVFFYSNFPMVGDLYYSFVDEMLAARTRGSPRVLTQARTFRASILFDNDNLPLTPPREFNNLRAILRTTSSRGGRANIRFGRGRRGEIYWTSKGTGQVFLFTMRGMA